MNPALAAEGWVSFPHRLFPQAVQSCRSGPKRNRALAPAQCVFFFRFSFEGETASRIAGMRFVSGPDFSRAAAAQNKSGFSPCGSFEGARLQPCRNRGKMNPALAPEGRFSASADLFRKLFSRAEE
jgi:hypothetical protein